MSLDADALYALLPAIHRARDLEAARRIGSDTGPLRQLVGLIAEQLGAIEENLDQLYDDQFIETCADWVVPYIGDLVGYVPIRSGSASLISRAEVANTIRWRRAKGTVQSIEGVARDVTGRDVVVVEYFRRLATTAHLDHIRTGVGTASLRNAAPFLDPGGPFDAVAHNAELRPASAGGRWSVPNVVCFLWPWTAWQRNDADPVAIDATRFVFHPLGIDGPLLNAPTNGPPGRGDANAVARRLRLRENNAPDGAAGRSIEVTVGGVSQTFAICDLSDTGSDPETSDWAHMPASGIAVDPERGRLAFATQPAGAVQVSFWYPSPGLLGGGAYPRGSGFDVGLRPLLTVGPSAAFPTIAAAMASPGLAGGGVIEVGGDARIDAGIPATINVPAGRKLEIRAADGSWPTLVLTQPLVIEGGPGAELVLDGFIIEGAGLDIPANVAGNTNGLRRLTLRHCTLVPGYGLTHTGAPLLPGQPSIVSASVDTVLVLEHCISGPLGADPGGQLRISDSIVDAGDVGAPAIGGASDRTRPSAALWIYNSTVRGGVATTLLALASNAMCLGAVSAQQRQSGVVRFSYLGGAYTGPRQYSCAPIAPPPLVRSWQVGVADYARLSASSPPAILTGADDGGQIGAYHGALDTPLEDGLRVRLAEFTPFGRESGFLHAHDA